MRKLILIACLAVWPPAFLFAQNIVPMDVRDGAVIGFRWQGDSIHGEWEPHAAMLIPVTLKHCPRQFFMQFDLGAPASVLYKNKIDAIRSRYPAAFPDTGSLRHFTFQSGKTAITARAISVKQFVSNSINWQSSRPEIIGTIGADLLNGRIAIIDYPKRTIHLRSSVPAKLARRARLTDFVIAHNRILFPARINGQATLLFFDTGSSMFELITDRETCIRMAVPGAEAHRFDVESWGRVLTANTLPARGNVELAGISVPLRKVTFMEGADSGQVAFMKKMGIGGMTGNRLFLRHVLVIDMLRRQFAIAGDF